jgi:ATP-dependent Clp protease adaptor protein ClpS
MSKENIKTKKSTKELNQIKYPSRYNVVFLNDDHTPMEFVIHLLVEVFNKNIQQAKDITLKIHNDGRCIVASYHYELAEQKAQEASLISRHNGHPLQVIVEQQ